MKPVAVLDWKVRLDSLAGERGDVTLKVSPDVHPRLAEAIGVDRLLACEAELHLIPGRSALDVDGTVRARVVQTCVVTLEPFEAEIVEPVEARFAPEADIARLEAAGHAAADETASTPDIPEPILDGTVDLGALVQEFLTLAVDPYPRKPGVEFEPRTFGDDHPSPFSQLAVLKGSKGDPE